MPSASPTAYSAPSFFTQLSQDLKEFCPPDEDRRFTLGDLRIRTKTKRIIPFSPNEVQEIYLDDLAPGWRAGNYQMEEKREILLKARQFGFSTLILALFFLDTINTPNTQTVVIAHDAESTVRLFRMVHRFYDHLPVDKRPKKRYSNRRELDFAAPLDSLFFVGTAGSGEFGRGGTINNVHGSEVAFWPDAGDLVAGLLQAVPADGNVFLETTANGQSNWYFDEYQAALRGDSVYLPRFYGWPLHSDYRAKSVPAEFKRNPDEETLAERHGLDDAQLLWRRGKIKELRRKFPQEYPINAHEAFLSSGGRILTEFIPEDAPTGHLVDDFIPPTSWRHYLVIDPGWNTTAGLWAAVDPDGDVWEYGEHYLGQAEEAGGQGYYPREHFKCLHAMWKAFGRPKVRVLMDPAGFDLRRTDTGKESPSWYDEFMDAARAVPDGEWFRPIPADNADPLALRVNRYLAAHKLKVCRGMAKWLLEQQKWVRKQDRTSGRYGYESPVPDEPIKRLNHLMACQRYLCNELPDPLPVPVEGPVPGSLAAHWAHVRAELDGDKREWSGV